MNKPVNKSTATRGQDLLRKREAVDKWDLWQESLIGMYEAAKTYDPKKGEFSTHVDRWIFGRLFKAVEGPKYTLDRLDDQEGVTVYPNSKSTSVRGSPEDTLSSGETELQKKSKLQMEVEKRHAKYKFFAGKPSNEGFRWRLRRSLTLPQLWKFKKTYGLYKSLYEASKEENDIKASWKSVANRLNVTDRTIRNWKSEIRDTLRGKFPSLVVDDPTAGHFINFDLYKFTCDCSKNGKYEWIKDREWLECPYCREMIIGDRLEPERVNQKIWNRYYHSDERTLNRDKAWDRWQKVFQKRKKENKKPIGSYSHPKYSFGPDGKLLLYTVKPYTLKNKYSIDDKAWDSWKKGNYESNPKLFTHRDKLASEFNIDLQVGKYRKKSGQSISDLDDSPKKPIHIYKIDKK